MMLPAYSLRRLLLFVTLCGFVFLVPAMAARGHLWAIGAAVALLSAMFLVIVQGLLYLALRTFDRVASRGATDESPEQSLHATHRVNGIGEQVP